MNWKVKAWIQNAIARLPSGASYATYYFVQRHLGGLREVSPMSRLAAGVRMARYIEQEGRTVEGKTFLEVGTGHELNLPIALWLLGAGRVVTVDVNPYLKAELVFEDVGYMREHAEEVGRLFEGAGSAVFGERFGRLMEGGKELEGLLAMTGIEYRAPADATRLEMEDGSVDYHVSFATLEHIPPRTLAEVLREGKRLVGGDGLLVHWVDFSDHFSHSDRSIGAIHFLRFSDEEWERLAGNRYMYDNRLRVDDVVGLFAEAGLRVMAVDGTVDEEAVEALRRGFVVDGKFGGKGAEVNGTVGAWVVAAGS